MIPASLTEIGEGAFNACYELASIELVGTVEQWNAVIKPDKWNLYFAAK
ncbi:MAG: hypothetical protein IJS83_01870 [Acholeplasmatales bacterium]|nr:hypothetical protein [Acholeplasmatales bacterium]